jgi:hypothetical protein
VTLRVFINADTNEVVAAYDEAVDVPATAHDAPGRNTVMLLVPDEALPGGATSEPYIDGQSGLQDYRAVRLADQYRSAPQPNQGARKSSRPKE